MIARFSRTVLSSICCPVRYLADMPIKRLYVKAELDQRTCTLLEQQARRFKRSRTKHLSLLLHGLAMLYGALPPEMVRELDSVLSNTDTSHSKQARKILRELTRNSFPIPVNSQLIRNSDGGN